MKPKALFLTLILFSSFCFLNAQSESFRYARSGGDGSIGQFEVDTLGNNYIVGSYNNKFFYQDKSIIGNTQSEGDLFILKTTPSGNPVYLHSIRGTDNGNAVSLRKFIVKQSGELYILFSTNGVSELIIGKRTMSLDPLQKPTVLAKFSRSGFLEWTKTLLAVGTSASLTANDIDIDSEGNVFVAGNFSGTNAKLGGINVDGLEDVNKIFLVKYLADGTNSWGSTCGHTTDTVGNIFANDVEVSPDGTIFLSGSYNGRRQFIFNKDYLMNQGVSNAYLSAFDVNGTTQWAIPYEGNGTIVPGMISVDEQSNAAFSCLYNSPSMFVNGQNYYSSTDYNVLISNVQPNKTFNWVSEIFTYLSFASQGERYVKIKAVHDTTVYVIGEGGAGLSYVYFKAIDNQGVTTDLLQTTSVGNVFLGKSHIDEHGNFAFAGTTSTDFYLGTSLISGSTYGTSYFARVLNSGDVSYRFQRPSNTIDNTLSFNGIGYDKYGNLFVAGNFLGTNVSLEDHYLSENTESRFFLAQYSLIGSIRGKVKDFYSNPITKGMVKLIGYTFLQKSPMADSVEIQADGSFEFPIVPLGKYLLKAIPDNSDGSHYMETYFPIVGNWEEAEHIIVNRFNLNFSNLFITVPEQQEFIGEARLSGEITKIEEEDIFKGIMKKPSAKSKATLATAKAKSNYDVIAETEADDYGFFEFDNVEDGSYTIFIDIPGLPSVDPHTVYVTNGFFISNINYYVSEEDVTGVDTPTGIVPTELDIDSRVKVFPNPNNGNFNIESSNGKTIDSAIICDIQGKVVKEYRCIQGKLKVNGLEKGLYIVSAISEGNNFKFKLIVNR